MFGYGLEMGGPLEMTLGWPLATVFTLAVAASMAELCSAYPTAGATYHWAADLGGKGWGWLVAWLNILGLIAAQAGINYSCAQFILPFLNLPSTPVDLFCMFAFILLTQGILNHYGIRLVAILNDCSVTVHIAGVAAVVLALFFLAPKQPVSFLFEAVNSNGRSPYWWAFVLGLLQAQWTYTGFDASAHMAEETHDPRRRAPWGIVLSVAVSGVAGYFLLLALTLAIHSIPGGAGGQRRAGQSDSGGDRHPATGAGRQGGQRHGGAGVHGDVVLRLGLHHLGVARAVFAGARPRHARSRSRCAGSARGTARRRPAIWLIVAASMAAMLWTKAVPVVTSLSTVALYLAYTIPIALAWRARRAGSDWPQPGGLESGPFRCAAESGGHAVCGFHLRSADHAAQ